MARSDNDRARSEGRFLVGGVVVDDRAGRLLVGERVDGGLEYRGTVALGVPAELLSALAVCPLVRATSPFVDRAPSLGVTWLDPRLTVDITYERSDPDGGLVASTLGAVGLDVADED